MSVPLAEHLLSFGLVWGPSNTVPQPQRPAPAQFLSKAGAQQKLTVADTFIYVQLQQGKQLLKEQILATLKSSTNSLK